VKCGERIVIGCVSFSEMKKMKQTNKNKSKSKTKKNGKEERMVESVDDDDVVDIADQR
jgi:hypothetical protein